MSRPCSLGRQEAVTGTAAPLEVTGLTWNVGHHSVMY